MSLIRINPRFYARLVTVIRDSKRNYSVVAKENEFSETPQYPPILDLSYKGRLKRKHQSWHKEIKDLNTVEEKLIKINMPRYYGWKSVIVSEDLIPYNCEAFAQHVTRTHIVEEKGLPKYYDRIITSEKLDATYQQVKKQIEDVIIFEHVSRRYLVPFLKPDTSTVIFSFIKWSSLSFSSGGSRSSILRLKIILQS